MSLINDALKRVEKSINDNSSTHQPKQVPPFTLESSGRNKKLFFIILIGGTLFFSILILLLMLIFSDTILPPSPQTPIIATSNAPNSAENLVAHQELPNQIEQPPSPIHNQLAEPKLNNSISEEPQEPSTDLTAHNTQNSIATSDESADNHPEAKNLNQEFFESIVNLASKAFISNTKASVINQPTPINNQPTPAKAQLAQQTQKENYSLSTAQETLDRIEQESHQSKKLPESKIQKFIDSLSITGVMISKDASMVLINNHVYATNDVINPTFNLRLSEIHPQKIILQDDTGSTYTVTF